jgi:hypothetical protein
MLKMSLVLFAAVGLMSACASNPNKAEKIETKIENTEEIGAGRSLGVNQNKEMITQKKVKLSEYLRTLQYEVYGLEKTIYGDDETGNKGKWGVLEDCRMTLNSAQMDGNGTYFKMPEKARLTVGDGMVQKIGLDENNQLVGISEDYLKNRIQKFENFKTTYESRKDWYDTQLKICKMAVDSKNYKAAAAQQTAGYPQPAKAAPLEMDVLLCKYVRPGASLKEVFNLALEKGWMLKDEFQPETVVNSISATDGDGTEKSHVLRLGDWSLAYENETEFNALMNQGGDSKLVAWLSEDATNVPARSQCLQKKDRLWNTFRK